MQSYELLNVNNTQVDFRSHAVLIVRVNSERLGLPVQWFIQRGSQLIDYITSGNFTPGGRFYSDLLDTLADSVCIHQLVLKHRSKSQAACIIVGG